MPLLFRFCMSKNPNQTQLSFRAQMLKRGPAMSWCLIQHPPWPLRGQIRQACTPCDGALQLRRARSGWVALICLFEQLLDCVSGFLSFSTELWITWTWVYRLEVCCHSCQTVALRFTVTHCSWNHKSLPGEGAHLSIIGSFVCLLACITLIYQSFYVCKC